MNSLRRFPASSLAPAAVLLAAALPTGFDLGLLVAGVALAFVVLGGSGLRRFSTTDALVLALIAAYTVTSSTGIHPARSLVLGYPLALGAVLYVVVSRSQAGAADLRRGAVALSAVALVFVVWTLVTPSPDDSAAGRILSTGNLLFVVPNDAILLAVIAALVLPLSFDSDRRLRPLGLVVWIASLSLAFVLESRGIVVALLAAAALWALSELRREPRTTWILLASVVALVIIDLAFGGPFRSKFDGLWDNRFILWQSAWRQFMDAPFLGQGPGSFGLLHEPALVSGGSRPFDDRVMPWPHNLMLEALAGGGLALAVTVVALWSHGLYLAFRRSGPGVWRRACGIALLVLGLAAVYEASLLRLWFTLTLFTLIGYLDALETRRHAPRIASASLEDRTDSAVPNADRGRAP